MVSWRNAVDGRPAARPKGAPQTIRLYVTPLGKGTTIPCAPCLNPNRLRGSACGFIYVMVSMLLTSCSTAHISYSPLPGVNISAPIPLRSGGNASLANGKGGHYKTGKPYRVAGRTYYPLSTASGYDQTGMASWYGRDFHGKLTANGERYDMHALSAAHKTLPLPSLVRVTNLENGRSVVVRVNDRGPFVKRRLIDLSWAAANALGYAGQGTARVRVQSLDTASPPPVSAQLLPKQPAPSLAGMYVQLGAFAQPDNASKLKTSLSAQYPSIRVQPFIHSMQTLYRVRIGPFSDVQTIEHTVLSLQQQGYSNAVVVIE